MEPLRISIALLLSITFIIIAAQRFRLHPFFALMVGSILFGVIAGIKPNAIFSSMQSGFGSLLQQIGFVVAIGSVMGTVLEKVGAMETLGLATTSLFKNKVAVAMMLLGLLVGIPVFADSGFIVLSRLVPTIAQVSNASQGTLALCLANGLLTTHTLVPPTPGPLAAAANLGLSDQLGLVILTGLLFSIPVAVVAMVIAKILGKNLSITKFELTTIQSNLPVWKSILPLLIPVVLITLGSVSNLISLSGNLKDVLQILGLPMVSLSIGLFLAVILIDFKSQRKWPEWISESLKDAGIILLITGAGGSFGAVIKASAIENIVQQYANNGAISESGILLFAFAMAAILKTAQGSTTSSMIITSSVVGPIAVGLGITSTAKLLLILMSIGGGGMVVSHANDSLFWVISKFGGIHHTDLLKSYTVITLLQGLTVFVIAFILMQFV